MVGQTIESLFFKMFGAIQGSSDPTEDRVGIFLLNSSYIFTASGVSSVSVS